MAAIAGAAAFAITTGVRAAPSDRGQRVDVDVRRGLARGALHGRGVVVTCLLVSLAPALQRRAFTGGGDGLCPRGGPVAWGRLAVQVAIATVLVLSAALIVRGIQQAATAPDFALHRTIAVTLRAPADAGYDWKTRDRIAGLLASAAKTSGLEIGLAGTVPASGRPSLSTSVNVPQSEVEFRTFLVPLSTAALRVLEVPLVRGRWASDDPDAGEAVINETLARQVWPDGGRGRRLTLTSTGRTT
jgi:hypothetical protein